MSTLGTIVQLYLSIYKQRYISLYQINGLKIILLYNLINSLIQQNFIFTFDICDNKLFDNPKLNIKTKNIYTIEIADYFNCCKHRNERNNIILYTPMGLFWVFFSVKSLLCENQLKAIDSLMKYTVEKNISFSIQQFLHRKQ